MGFFCFSMSKIVHQDGYFFRRSLQEIKRRHHHDIACDQLQPVEEPYPFLRLEVDEQGIRMETTDETTDCSSFFSLLGWLDKRRPSVAG